MASEAHSYPSEPSIPLYSIAGHYENPPIGWEVQSQSVAFGGYFKKAETPDGESTIRGQVVDMWGDALIEGVMTQESISFKKIYQDESGNQVRPEVQYSLTGDGRDWEGTYMLRDHSDMYEGNVICRTDIIVDQAREILGGPIRR